MVQPASDTIMVIGDDSNFCYLMRRYVRQSSHQIVFAYLGDDALALARRNDPCAIFVEVDLPGSAGWSILKDLKANHDTCSIPIVLCSWQEDETRGIEKHADLHLRKPILYDDFLSALSQLGIDSEEQE